MIAEADISLAAGSVCDATAGRFGLQRGAPVREDGTPLSAAGPVWRHHGEAATRTLLWPRGTGDLAEPGAAEIDNGVGQPGDALGLASRAEDAAPPRSVMAPV